MGYGVSLVLLVLPPLLGVLFALAVLFGESKLIAVAQKRLGISFLGRHGWVHLPADLVKFWFKQVQGQGFGGGVWLGGGLGLAVAYLGWLGNLGVFLLTDGVSLPAELGDYSFFVLLGYALATNLFLVVVVLGTRSKYATIAGASILVAALSTDVFFVCVWLLVVAHSGGFDIEDVAETNTLLTPSCALPPLALFLFYHALIEAKRAPFDHAEAESELVAGHLVEYGGRPLLVLYVCEYMHVLFSVFMVWVFVVGGVWAPCLLGSELLWACWL